TLVRYVSKCQTEGDRDQLDRIVSASLLIFTLAGLLTILLGFGTFYVILNLSTKVPQALHREVEGMAAISILCLAVTLPLSIFPAMLDGLGRYSAKSLVRTLFLLGRVAGVLLVLWYGGGLVPLAVVFTATTLAEHSVMLTLVRRSLPELRPAPWRADRATLRLIRGYSFDSFLAMLAGRINFKTDAIVIGLCGQLGLIPFFDMPSRLVEYAKNLIRSATTTLTPAFSALEAKNNVAAIRQLFLTGCRYALYLSLPIQAALLLFGGSFLELWLKDESFRVLGEPVLWILAGTLCVSLMQSVAARVLYGVGRLRGFSRLMLLEAGLNLVLSLALIGPFGIRGVALGTALPDLAICIFVLLGVCRMLEIDDRLFFRQALLKPLLVTAIVVPAWLRLAQFLPPVTWLSFVELIAAGVMLFAVLALLLERGQVWLLQIRKQFRRALALESTPAQE
ncbi:MAG TPA: polysaccharide biosynthesis C-terminal domain-containing protein, partial [Gemmataceae bacterium]|nr:polysaccharide biosynthesis C-terminal domain-containing protein [Gemmataceae bacterium]